MSDKILFSIIETSAHPNFAELYHRLGYNELRFPSQRKAISKLKSVKPHVIVAEFFYGYGNNYAGVNLSNLDVLLCSTQRYAPDVKVIILIDKSERKFAEKLAELFNIYSIEQYPLSAKKFEELLK